MRRPAATLRDGESFDFDDGVNDTSPVDDGSVIVVPAASLPDVSIVITEACDVVVEYALGVTGRNDSSILSTFCRGVKFVEFPGDENIKESSLSPEN